MAFIIFDDDYMKRKTIILGTIVSILFLCAYHPITDKKQAEDNEVTLVMVGDMLMHMPINRSGQRADGDMDFTHLFTYTKRMISEADLALVNQEVILGGDELRISSYDT